MASIPSPFTAVPLATQLAMRPPCSRCQAPGSSAYTAAGALVCAACYVAERYPEIIV